MSSRSKASSKLDKLAAYKRAREGGGRNWKQEDDGDLYDEVDEDQYKSIVRGRLQKDDFIVDDGVEGYADNGMDDWGQQDLEESDDEVKRPKTRKKNKSKIKPPVSPPVVPTLNDYRPKPTVANEDDFMSNILGNMENVVDTGSMPRKRKIRAATPPPPSSDDDVSSYHGGVDTPYADTSSDGPMDGYLAPTTSNGFGSSPFKKPRNDLSKPESKGKSANDLDFDEADFPMDDFTMDEPDIKEDIFGTMKMEVDDTNLLEINTRKKAKPLPAKPAVMKKEESEPAWLSVHAALAVSSEDGFAPLEANSSKVKTEDINALEEDGSLRFFWLDYLEQDGRVYFIGKLKDKTTGLWISCCVTVDGLQRNLFLLPREKQLDDGYETDIVPGMKDVYGDFDALRKKAGITSFRGKFVKRKYAFGESGIPTQETQWMKVIYPFTEPQLSENIATPNIARVFGTKTSAFELLVLKRKIMGPCWLEIKKPNIKHNGFSWCKFEASVSDPKDINPFKETDQNAPKDVPPLTVMSLSIRTIVNYKENKREIVCVTARTWSNLDIDDPTPPDQLPCTVQTLVRPLDKFPPNFAAAARATKKGMISAEANERILLNKLLLTIYKADPDVLIGHDFLGVSLDVLLTRMRDLKADHWSRIGRFRRSRWPNIGRQGTNIKFLNGRLLCDLASDGAKGMISSTTWSMTEMCTTHLRCERQEIDPDDVANYFDSSLPTPDKLLMFVRHCELDAHYQMAIAARVQILPLTKQLTNLAGNSWNKTLNGGRAERNEYILLHEFHRLKYICPDKTWGKKAAAAVKAEADDGGNGAGAGSTSKSKRDKYKGGLVFEPKRGLWDKYILVMDFNSLYPSIIQEYNIDFTTVVRDDAADGDEEKIPEVPSSEIPQGVLPRLIATLVGRRRQVKGLMKDRTITQAKRLQYDIKQQALKLTANSMYGCLGFEYSRFYARPLAALTTFKGREILTHTRELAESLQLDVVYGDTDSVFVNSNVTDFAEALKISNEFKKQVNEQYKLLEIDLDGVFQRLLLLQKKKYAALKMEDATRTSIEVKGLDMKRREYCTLSKNVSQYVLNQILSGEATEVVVENIHEYLSTIGENIRGSKIGLEEFIIFKRLGKNPEDYPDAKSQPHVTVALRMKARGQSARAGDVIPYIFCQGEGGESSKSGQADKAHHPDELRRADSNLHIDFEYYISQQILPPIERLCDPIEGTDRSRLAECLGLDPSRFRSQVGGEADDRGFSTLESQMQDHIRFKDCKMLTMRCRKCSGEMQFHPIAKRDVSLLQPSGPVCVSCEAPMNPISLSMQLELQIRACINRFYESWTVCDDPTCRNRTRMMSVYGRRCLKSGCRGNVFFEYTDAQLYNQLMYYASLFDSEKIKQSAKGSGQAQEDAVVAVVVHQAEFIHSMRTVVDKYLSQCGRRFVELGSLFSYMKL